MNSTASAFGAPVPPGGSVIRILVLTDLVSSVKITESLGDFRASELSARHDHAARELIVRHGGLEIDKTDGFLLLFERPGDAVAYTLAYHQALDELSRHEDVELVARAGIHLGEVFLRRNPEVAVARGAKPLEVEGLAKPTAARVMSLAGGRQTLLTHAVFDLARRAAVDGGVSDAPLRWLAHGAYVFKGVQEPLDVFEVGIEGLAPLDAPPDREKAKRILEPGAEQTLGWRPAAEQPIPRRPSWVLVERVGAGGFGEVWLARHKTGEQRVFKFCFEAVQLRALKREVTLFRLLKEGLGHRHDIARILDWDFDEAPYFLESEYTAGGNLAEWAEGLGGLPEIPMTTRLALVGEVAEALEAAHSVGILHKDVKPENVLITVDRDGLPHIRLTDFGIGLVTDQDKLHGSAVTVLGFTEMEVPSESSTGGTLRYMAPELLEGGTASAQADIYSLGVMLYQMVVGDFGRSLAPGWKRDVADELLREDIASFVDGRPKRRPRRARDVAGCLRSLEQRRQARLDRAEAERSRRVRRLLATVASGALLVLTVVSVLALQAMRAREDADQRRRQAENLVDFMLFDLRYGLEDIGRLDLLGKVAAMAQNYLESQPEGVRSAQALRRRGTALMNTADVLLDQGETARAADGYRAARAIFRDLATRDPTKHLLDFATSHIKLGEAELKEGEGAAALETFRAGLAVAEELAAGRSDDPGLRLVLAEARYWIGRCLTALGRHDEALASLGSAMTALGGEPPPGAVWRAWKIRLDSQVQIGNVHAIRAELDLALPAYRDALRSVERLVAEDPKNLNWRSRHANCQTLIGNVQARGGDYPGAVDSYRAANQLYRSLVGEDPSNLSWRLRLGQSLVVKAEAHFLAGQFDEGFAAAVDARRIFEDLISRDPDDTVARNMLVHAHIALGHLVDARGEAGAALESYLAARSVLASLGSDEGTQWVVVSYLHVLIGHAYDVLGRLDEARVEWLEALALHEASSSGDPSGLERISRTWALLALGRVEEAKPLVARITEQDVLDPRLERLWRESGMAPL